MSVPILVGDVRECLSTMADQSVHCVVTSPPYFGLRAYGTVPQVWGGERDCSHAFQDSKICPACGAWKGEHGLEPSLTLWIANEVTIWREIRRVLRKDGVAWLNIGDSYAGGGRGGPPSPASTLKGNGHVGGGPKIKALPSIERGSTLPAGMHEKARAAGAIDRAWQPAPPELKGKQRMMLPARLAIALQDDGWWIRDEIIWAKPNPMPSSVTDRTTPAHEMVYMLTRSARYFYDGTAIAEPFAASSIVRLSQKTVMDQTGGAKQAEFDERGFNELGGSRTPSEIVKTLSARVRKPAGWQQDKAAHSLLDHASPRDHDGVGKFGNETPRSLRNSFARPAKDAGGVTGAKPQHREGRLPINYGAEVHRSGNKERKLGDDRGRPDSHIGGSIPWAGTQRNKRSVWSIPTEPFPEAHFATFPTALVEPCILAATSARGVCPDCGAQWRRVEASTKETLGWYPSCRCGDPPALPVYPKPPTIPNGTHPEVRDQVLARWQRKCLAVDRRTSAVLAPLAALKVSPAVVLDPFLGSGTTALVAHRLCRHAVGIELNPDFAAMARKRIVGDSPLFGDVTIQGEI